MSGLWATLWANPVMRVELIVLAVVTGLLIVQMLLALLAEWSVKRWPIPPERIKGWDRATTPPAVPAGLREVEKP